MKHSAAEIIREYGPFPGIEKVNGVTYDGRHVWFASEDKLNALDPKTGEKVRAIDVAAHAGTAFDGHYLFQLSGDSIQKIDPNSGRVLSTIPGAWGRRLGAGVGRRDAVDGAISEPKNPSTRSSHRGGSSHHRIQPLRHGSHLGRWRALARHS